MENPDLVSQETGSRQTHSRLNYVPSGDTLRPDAIFSYIHFCIISGLRLTNPPIRLMCPGLQV